MIGGNSASFIQEFDTFNPYYGPGVPISSTTAICIAYYNITLDEPGRVMVNDKAMQVMGYTQIDKNATLTVQAQYNWHGAGVAVSPSLPAPYFPSRPSIAWIRELGAENSTQAVNGISIPGPVYGRFVRESNPNVSDNVILSDCGAGILQVTYRTKIRATEDSSIGVLPVDPQPGEELWRFITSLDVYKC